MKNDENYVDITEGGDMSQKSILRWIDAVLIPHTRNRPSVFLLDYASINHSELTR